ncbi:MAG: LysR family transcriptional regulator [Rhodospirillales bacterium]|nr:LysR family transcriptional regulator [Rhodospirillales bacterium]
MRLFDDLEAFARVVEAGSFTRAAGVLKVSKSRVSESVRSLEARLGVRLLDRTTRRVAPTEAGRLLFVRCRRAIEETEAGLVEVMAQQNEPVGHLRIGTPEGFAVRYLLPSLATFLDAHPRMTVEVVAERHPKLVDESLDVAVCVDIELHPNFIAWRVATSQGVICAAPSYLKRFGRPCHPEEIRQHRFLGFAGSVWSRELRFRDGHEELIVPISPALLCNTIAGLHAALVEGAGLTFAPYYSIHRELDTGSLVQVLEHWPLPSSGIYVAYPSNRLIPAKVRCFVDHLTTHLRRHLPDASPGTTN